MAKKETPSLFADLEPQVGRDEMNFCEFPIAVLSERAPKDCNKLIFSDTVLHRGEQIERSVNVIGSSEFGLPTAKDEEVLLGLLALTKRLNNFTSPLIEVSRYELLRVLSWSDDGPAYKRLMASLDTWSSVMLKYENAWYDNESKEYIDVNFHVLDHLTFFKSEAKGRAKRLRIKWGDIIFRSFQASYVKQLDLNLYQNLRTSVAKRLFRFLDKHLYHRPYRREFDLHDLAFEHVGLSRNYEPWKVKQKLDPAIQELEEQGYLVSMPSKERYIPNGRGKYRIVFEKHIVEEPTTKKTAVPALPSLAEDLVQRGIHRDSALKLISEHSEEAIRQQIAAFDWLMTTQDKPEKPSGYLYVAIDKKFPLPDGYHQFLRSQATKARQRETASERSRKLREEAEQIEAERKEAEARRQRVDAYLATLTTTQQEKFKAKAMSAGPSELREQYEQLHSRGLQSVAETIWYRILAAALPKSAK